MGSNISKMVAVKGLKDIDVSNKRVLIRVDFNVPLDNDNNITDDRRIRSALPTINYCLDHGADSIILVTHFGRPKGGYDERYSLKHINKRLEQLLQRPVEIVDDLLNLENYDFKASSNKVFLLENIRFHEGEKKNDPQLCKTLASLCDVYVNDAFGTSHRKHASTYGIAEFVDTKVAGFLMLREVQAFSKALENPKTPILLVIGGAKVSTKITLLKSVLQKVDKLIIGGAMSNTFLKALGYDMKESFYEDDYVATAKEVLDEAFAKSVKVYLPVDVVVTDSIESPKDIKFTPAQEIEEGYRAVDIGPATTKLFEEVIYLCNTIIWNGPMGIFENELFSKGTSDVAKAIGNSYAYTVVGGGDTADAVERIGRSDNFSFISTGGGASLELLEGKVLPGFERLDHI